MNGNNPYLNQIDRVLPRILALYDKNPVSPTIGLGDRYYWSWKLTDFGNATFQGAANGLARLLNANLLPEKIEKKVIIKRILHMVNAVATIRDSNGSLGEAFPHESSFCVTALVAYDLLTTVQTLANELSDADREKILVEISPLIRFLHNSDESHGLISNHLATAAAALYKYHALTGENSCARGRLFLDRIISHQSSEGWYMEYEGADPGYQSLCTYYLADLHHLRPDLELQDSLTRSVRFLCHFAHPDGSFGGVYGSRNTRFYFPGGLELLRNEIPEAGMLADYMRSSISSYSTVTLETMDEPNLIPMFNTYCLAAVLHKPEPTKKELLPCNDNDQKLLKFQKAGIVICGDSKSYTVISTHKGGVCYHFSKVKNKNIIDTGIVCSNKKGTFFTTQAFQKDNEVIIGIDKIKISVPLVQVNDSLPTPSQFIFLRFLNITVMRSLMINNLVKKFLVWLLFKRKRISKVVNQRTIMFGEKFIIADELLNKPSNWQKLKIDMPFVATQMASQGYWQKQDDAT